MKIEHVFAFLVIWAAVATLIVGLAWLCYWQYVLQNQWITQPFTHYEWWGFIFAFDQAWAWLWYVNFSLWLIVVGVIALFSGFFVALILATHY